MCYNVTDDTGLVTVTAPTDTDWMTAMACADADLDLFFGDNDRGVPGQRRVARAKAICATCPVVAPCLDFAMRTHSMFGVMGGTTQVERKAMRSGQRHASRPAGLRIVPMPTSSKTRPKDTRPASKPKSEPAPEPYRPFLPLDGTDLERLSVLRQLNPTDPVARHAGRTPAEWLAAVRWDGTAEQLETWLADQCRCGALGARDGGKIAIL